MKSGTISCDIISSTSLESDDRINLELEVNKILDILSDKFSNDKFYGRIIKGDYIECFVTPYNKSLRIALILKTFIKSLIFLKNRNDSPGNKYFRDYALRVSIAKGDIIFDKENEILDGEAIHMSGRVLQNMRTYNKEKIVIKNTLFFSSKNKSETKNFSTIFYLIDTLISKCSPKQSEVLFYKLLGKSEDEICKILNRNQSTVNQHSTAAGWKAIEQAVKLFEKTQI